MPVTKEQVLQALSVVKDPDLGRDIVSLGFIEELNIDDRNNVSFNVVLTTPACPVKEQLKQQSESVVSAIPGVRDVNANMTSRVRQGIMTERQGIPGVRNIVAVGSGKGGVGKSTVAVNLALALASDGARVGLLDADVYGPNVPLMMGTSAKPQQVGEKIAPVEAYGIKIMSMGFFIDADSPVIWRGPMLTKLLTQFMYDVEWGELDYLVMDMPPGTGDVQLTTAQSVPLTGSVMVSTPQDVALLDASKALMMFKKLNVPVLGIVENMSTFVCPHCQNPTDLFGHGGAQAAAARYSVPFLGEIPLHLRIREGGDAGRPVVVDAPGTPQAEAFMQVARNLAAQVSVVAYRQQEAKRGAPVAFFSKR
ncbi:MAG: iron-sulfur cluster carrier protein ApbC [Chloroflexota bacterium]|nr:iron-sulfur cluster carrier protein ApbC [Chloroflexota bacterium]MDQ5865618.1 iron-sulfur cluster carrier protein ApbC [Chloroflexota bacterium]